MKNGRFLIISMVLFAACNPEHQEDHTKARLNPITESVYASATIVPEEAYYCRAAMSGIIQEIYVEEGTLVKKGQPLFKISSTAEVSNRVKNASIALQEAKANYLGENNLLVNIALELQTLQEQNQLDSLHYERTKRLWDQHIGSKNELERSLLAYQASTSQLNSLHHQYAQTKINLKSQYEKAQNLAVTERSQLQDFEISSEIDGKIYGINKEVGEFISPQENFAEIGSARHFIIEMDIDEVDISKIALGDTAIIHLEAYPDKVYSSTLTYISDKKNESTQTFQVEGVFIESPPKLYHGLSGEANIVIARRTNVLLIPSDYLINGNKVLTTDGEIEVKVGVKSLEFVEIREGIDTTTTLIKPN